MPTHRRSFAFVASLVLAAGLACSHSDPFVTGSNLETVPLVSGTDVRLTYNSDQDYWPSWTEDSAGVLYAYVAPGRADHDRCVGLLPPGGGTRLWEMCDNQAGHGDSTDSFTAFALGRDGRLLYQEVTAHVGTEVPTTKALWLADSARPFTRRKLVAFPISIGGTSVDWLADLAWTGPVDFIGLAEEYLPVPHCRSCALDDSAFIGKFVVRGHIDGAGVTLTAISGTDGANVFALAEGGTAVVFARRGSNALQGVAANGGTPVLLSTVGSQNTIVGIACRDVTCLVATDQLVLLPNPSLDVFPNLNSPAGTLFRVNLTSGASALRRTNTGLGNGGMYASPLLLPNGTDIIVQVGGTAGRLHTASSALGDLYLFKGILP